MKINHRDQQNICKVIRNVNKLNNGFSAVYIGQHGVCQFHEG